jgi:hypothetical protein
MDDGVRHRTRCEERTQVPHQKLSQPNSLPSSASLPQDILNHIKVFHLPRRRPKVPLRNQFNRFMALQLSTRMTKNCLFITKRKGNIQGELVVCYKRKGNIHSNVREREHSFECPSREEASQAALKQLPTCHTTQELTKVPYDWQHVPRPVIGGGNGGQGPAEMPGAG